MTDLSHNSSDQQIEQVNLDQLDQCDQQKSKNDAKNKISNNRIQMLKGLKQDKIVEVQNNQLNTQNNYYEIDSQKGSIYNKSETQGYDDNQKVVVNLHEIDKLRQQKFKQVISTENSIDEAQSMIIRALQKKPKERRASNMNELIKITENLPFFRKYIDNGQRDILVKCCQQMEIEFFDKDQIVFEIGSIGEKFYLILQGEVEVYAKVPGQQVAQTSIGGQQVTKNIVGNQQLLQPQDKEISEQQSQINSQQGRLNEISFMSRYQQVSNSKVSQFDNQDVRTPLKSEFNDLSPQKKFNQNISEAISKPRGNSNFQSEMLQSINMKKTDSPNKMMESIKDQVLPVSAAPESVQLMLVKKLQEGQSFGELALIYNRPRLATIKSTTQCAFAVLEKKQFLEILKTVEQKNIVKQIDKLSEIPMFKQWSFESLKDIYLNSEIVSFRKNEIVFSKGDASNAAYIVLQGEFSIRNKYYTPSQNFENDVLLQKLESINKEGIDTLLKSHGSTKQRTFILLNMCTNEMFGEEDLLKQQNRSFEVFCSSFTGQLLMIKDIDFRLRVFERNDYIQEYILSRLKTKEMQLQQKEQNLMEQFSKYKNFLIENRQELKNIIFSQILMDQSCSVPAQSPYSQNQQGIIQGTLSNDNCSNFKSINSVESSRSKQSSYHRLFNTVGTQYSVRSANFDQLSPHSIMKNDFAQNSLSLQSQADSKQLSDHDYYQINSPQKNQCQQSGISNSFKIKNQRSHSDSSRNYTKSSYNPRTTYEFLDNIDNQPNIIQEKKSDNEGDQQDNKHDYKGQQIQSFTSPQKLKDKQIVFENSPQKLPWKRQTKQNIYNERLINDKVIPTAENLNEQKIIDNYQPILNQANNSPCSSTQTGFFQIEVSKRKKIMLAQKYDYQNYLQDKDSENRYLIPVKKILTKALKEKKPLLVEIAKQKQVEESLPINLKSEITSEKNKQITSNSTKQEQRNMGVKYKRQLNVKANTDSPFDSKQNLKNKSYYQFQVNNSPIINQQYYDVQPNIEVNALSSRFKQSPFKNQRSSKSADSNRLYTEKQYNQGDLTVINEKKQNHEQIISSKMEQIRPKSPKIFNQLIQLQITPFIDEVYLQSDKLNQTFYSKKQNSPTFIEQDQYKDQLNSRSPARNISPKKVIESYKQFLGSKQQNIEKSKKLGAFTAFNKTKDTTFYIQKRVEKRMIQTLTDWRRSSQTVQNTEFIPYNLQQLNNTVSIKQRTSLVQTPQQLLNLSLSLQTEKIEPPLVIEEQVHNSGYKSQRKSQNNSLF